VIRREWVAVTCSAGNIDFELHVQYLFKLCLHAVMSRVSCAVCGLTWVACLQFSASRRNIARVSQSPLSCPPSLSALVRCLWNDNRQDHDHICHSRTVCVMHEECFMHVDGNQFVRPLVCDGCSCQMVCKPFVCVLTYRVI